jgi:hypothetical protein
MEKQLMNQGSHDFSFNYIMITLTQWKKKTFSRPKGWDECYCELKTYVDKEFMLHYFSTSAYGSR